MATKVRPSIYPPTPQLNNQSLQIVEIIKTGTHRRITFSSQKATAVKTFCGVYGIGSIKASQLWDQGIKTLEDLTKWPGLTEGQKLGIQYYDDLAKRIPRSEVEEMYQFGQFISLLFFFTKGERRLMGLV